MWKTVYSIFVISGVVVLLVAAGCGGSKESGCTQGAKDCECRTDGTCDSGLSCEVGVCVEESCEPGTEGCPCDSGACDGDLKCAEDTCVQTLVINFSIDDSANQTYTAGELQWKGSFIYDQATGIITYDSYWGGANATYPDLYDDGPAASGGHEPDGAMAGDHIWGLAVFFPVPTENVDFEYGAQTSDGGWIWPNDGGTFTVQAGRTDPITVPGLTIPAFGQIDMLLTLDVTALGGAFVYTAGDTVTVKGSYAAWSEMACGDDGQNGDETAGDSVFSFALSENVGAGTGFPHSGLLNSGDQPQFVFVIAGVEYKGDIGGGDTGALTDGVSAYTKSPGGAWEQRTIEHVGADNNTAIDVP